VIAVLAPLAIALLAGQPGGRELRLADQSRKVGRSW
jgi:hypothetical protein